MKFKYNRIPANFWINTENIPNWSNNTRLLAIYLLTCSHRTTEGLFRLPKQYICADLNWSLKELDKPFNELLQDEFIKYDERVNIIFITNAIKYQTPDNPNQEKAAVRLLKELPVTNLLDEFILKVKQYDEGFYKRLIKEFGEPQALTQTQTLSLTQNNSSSQNDKKKRSEEKYSKESKPYKASSFLIDKILNNNPRARVPEKNTNNSLMQKWCSEMDKLHRIGPVGAKEKENKGYSWLEIYNLIEWCQNDSFWKTNILSANKFRQQIIKLENQMKKDNFSESETSTIKDLYTEAQEEDLKGEYKVL